MNEFERNLSDLELESVKTLINNKIIALCNGLEFRPDKKEVMNKIQSYRELLEKIK